MSKRKRPADDGVLVYSAGPDGARAFGPGGKASDQEGSAALSDLAPAEQTVRIALDSRAGHGKTLTVVSGLVLTGRSLDKLAKQLKQSCGTGGTVRGATIELQGDHRDRLARLLAQKGFRIS